MKLSANVSLGAVVRAMGVRELDGAIIKAVKVTVSYRRGEQDGIASFNRNGGDRLLVQNAEIERQDAIDLLSEDGWQFDDETAEAIDPRDLQDFIDACAAGDRCTALALVGRLFTGPSALAAEQLLLASGAQRGRRTA